MYCGGGATKIHSSSVAGGARLRRRRNFVFASSVSLSVGLHTYIRSRWWGWSKKAAAAAVAPAMGMDGFLCVVVAIWSYLVRLGARLWVVVIVGCCCVVVSYHSNYFSVPMFRCSIEWGCSGDVELMSAKETYVCSIMYCCTNYIFLVAPVVRVTVTALYYLVWIVRV